MDTKTTQTVGSFVANDYRTATVFQQYGIDFCCKGGRSIDEVCAQKGIAAEELLNALNETVRESNVTDNNYKTWPLDKLADYIQQKHHSYIEQSVPVLKQFLDKLCRVHGENHPELFQINDEFTFSANELAVHMKKEELILFPLIRKMVSEINSESGSITSIKEPIQVMMNEHEIEGDRFRKITELSQGYTPPEDGCTTYRVAFSLLKEFEEDLHLHIHLENNILFPGALAMEN